MSAAEPGDAAKPPGRLIPDALANWTVTYSDFSFLEGEYAGTFSSDGRLRLHTTSFSQRGKPDIESRLSEEETRAVYAMTREIMNWYRMEAPGPRTLDGDIESRISLSLKDGRFVALSVRPDWNRLGVQPQGHAIAAICMKHLRQAGARWGIHDTGSSGIAVRKPRASEEGILPASLKFWSFGIADKNWWYGKHIRLEGGASIVWIRDDEVSFYAADQMKLARPFPVAERAPLYALARKIFNGYELQEANADQSDKTATPRVVLFFDYGGQKLQLNVDRDTLARLGVLDEYIRLARLSARQLGDEVDVGFLLPWDAGDALRR